MTLPASKVARLRIQIPGRRGMCLVTVDDEGRWRSAVRPAQNWLNRHDGGPGLVAMPARVPGEAAHAIAQVAVDKYGGRLLTKAPPPPDPPATGGRVQDAEPSDVVY